MGGRRDCAAGPRPGRSDGSPWTVRYSRAKDAMFQYTDTKWAPLLVVDANDKRRARLNCIRHLLSVVSYQDVTSKPLKLPMRQPDDYLSLIHI